MLCYWNSKEKENDGTSSRIVEIFSIAARHKIAECASWTKFHTEMPMMKLKLLYVDSLVNAQYFLYGGLGYVPDIVAATFIVRKDEWMKMNKEKERQCASAEFFNIRSHGLAFAVSKWRNWIRKEVNKLDSKHQQRKCSEESYCCFDWHRPNSSSFLRRID